MKKVLITIRNHYDIKDKEPTAGKKRKQSRPAAVPIKFIRIEESEDESEDEVSVHSEISSGEKTVEVQVQVEENTPNGGKTDDDESEDNSQNGDKPVDDDETVLEGHP